MLFRRELARRVGGALLVSPPLQQSKKSRTTPALCTPVRLETTSSSTDKNSGSCGLEEKLDELLQLSKSGGGGSGTSRRSNSNDDNNSNNNNNNNTLTLSLSSPWEEASRTFMNAKGETSSSSSNSGGSAHDTSLMLEKMLYIAIRDRACPLPQCRALYRTYIHTTTRGRLPVDSSSVFKSRDLFYSYGFHLLVHARSLVPLSGLTTDCPSNETIKEALSLLQEFFLVMLVHYPTARSEDLSSHRGYFPNSHSLLICEGLYTLCSLVSASVPSSVAEDKCAPAGSMLDLLMKDNARVARELNCKILEKVNAKTNISSSAVIEALFLFLRNEFALDSLNSLTRHSNDMFLEASRVVLLCSGGTGSSSGSLLFQKLQKTLGEISGSADDYTSSIKHELSDFLASAEGGDNDDCNSKALLAFLFRNHSNTASRTSAVEGSFFDFMTTRFFPHFILSSSGSSPNVKNAFFAPLIVSVGNGDTVLSTSLCNWVTCALLMKCRDLSSSRRAANNSKRDEQREEEEMMKQYLRHVLLAYPKPAKRRDADAADRYKHYTANKQGLWSLILEAVLAGTFPKTESAIVHEIVLAFYPNYRNTQANNQLFVKILQMWKMHDYALSVFFSYVYKRESTFQHKGMAIIQQVETEASALAEEEKEGRAAPVDDTLIFQYQPSVSMKTCEGLLEMCLLEYNNNNNNNSRSSSSEVPRRKALFAAKRIIQYMLSVIRLELYKIDHGQQCAGGEEDAARLREYYEDYTAKMKTVIISKFDELFRESGMGDDWLHTDA